MILSHSLVRHERMRSKNPRPRGDFIVPIGWVSLAALSKKDPGALG